MEVLIDNQVDDFSPDINRADRFVKFCLRFMSAPEESELSLSFVDEDAIHNLNKDYRGVDRATDVLSFECDGAILEEGAQVCVLGDIVICPEVCKNQCVDFGNTLAQELELLTCHGVLHLFGFDHIDDDDAKIMEAKEKEILKAWRKENE